MKNSDIFSITLKLLLVTAGVAILLTGMLIIWRWANSPIEISKESVHTPHSDSSVIKKVTNDTANQKTTSTAETTVYRTTKTEACSTCNVTLKDNMLKKGYDFVLLGLLFLLSIFVLPSVSTINILSLFGATFRETVDAGKAVINESVNAANTNISPSPPQTTSVPVTEIQKEKVKSILPTVELSKEKIQIYTSDPQKGRWGGLSERNGRKLIASVIPLPGSKELFKVIIKVIATDIHNPIRNKVLFHLHNSFPNPNPEIYVIQGEARLELIAWGAFTIGAEADDRATRLELDLADLPDAPLLFTSR